MGVRARITESAGWAIELLERSSFLDALAGYATEARQGNGRLVLVSGESGIGKTVLVEAFRAQLPGARWLWGACDALLTPRPLGPLFDIAAETGGQLAQLCGQGAAPDRLFEAFLARHWACRYRAGRAGLPGAPRQA